MSNFDNCMQKADAAIASEQKSLDLVASVLANVKTIMKNFYASKKVVDKLCADIDLDFLMECKVARSNDPKAKALF